MHLHLHLNLHLIGSPHLSTSYEEQVFLSEFERLWPVFTMLWLRFMML